MTNMIGASGLQINTLRENIDFLIESFRQIYGSDIITDQNSPDGQLIGILSQMATNQLEAIAGVYSSMALSTAVGTELDQRAALLGVQRNGATFTVVQVDLTASEPVSLPGLDDRFADPEAAAYGVLDVTGNVYYLIDSAVLQPGTHSLLFRAASIGAVEVVSNTINAQQTIYTQITAVNNPTAATIVGQNEESDAAFRMRLQRSQGIHAQALLEGLRAALMNLDGMQSAVVYENVSGTTDSDGIPGHSIWVIVNGGSARDIGLTIWHYLTITAGQKETAYHYDVPLPSGGTKRMYFDRATPVELDVKFDIQPLVSGAAFDLDGIRKYIADNLSYSINEPALAANILCRANEAIGSQGGGGFPQNVLLSYGDVSPTNYLPTPSKQSIFNLDPDNITITVLGA